MNYLQIRKTLKIITLINIQTISLILLISIGSFSHALSIKCDKITIMYEKYTGFLSGNIKISHDDTDIFANEAMVIYDKNAKEIIEIKADGNIKVQNNEITATGDKILYNKELLILYGNLLITKNGNQITGDKLVYNLKNKEAIIDSSKSNGSVKIEIKDLKKVK